MRCGLLGEHLGHSFSPQIHAQIADHSYELIEVSPDKVEDFVKNNTLDAQTTTPERLLAWKKEFPTDALGFCYDAGHANIMSKGKLYPEGAANTSWKYTTPNTPQWDDHIIDKMLPEIVTCHLHDNTGERDQHNLPGNGNVDWQNIREKLMTAPRLKCIQSEVSVSPNQIPLRRLIGKFEELFPECKGI